TEDFWFIVAIQRSEDETEIRNWESAGRAGHQGHPPCDPQAVFVRGEDPHRAGRPSRRRVDRGAVPARGDCREPVLHLVEGIPGSRPGRGNPRGHPRRGTRVMTLTGLPPTVRGWGNVPVPYTASWTEEEHFFLDFCPYACATAICQRVAPGQGKPQFGKPHMNRQREAIARNLCDLCGRPLKHRTKVSL